MSDVTLAFTISLHPGMSKKKFKRIVAQAAHRTAYEYMYTNGYKPAHFPVPAIIDVTDPFSLWALEIICEFFREGAK